MLSAYISIFGLKIHNYVLMLVLFSLLICIVKTVVAQLNRKQSVKSRERKEKVVQLQKESNGDQKELADRIYDYYKETNYNPFLNYFLKFLIILLDLLIITAAVATFKPITNFHIISDESANSIINIYKENEIEQGGRYTEIRLLKDLDKYEDKYTAAGVSAEEIQTLRELKETFKVGNLETYIVPSLNGFSVQALPCLFAFLLFAINSIWSFVFQIKKVKNIKLSDPDIALVDKLNTYIAPISNIITNIIVCTFIFKVPIVISFYFIINYGWNFIQKIIVTIVNKKKGDIVVETKDSTSQG